MPPAYIRTTTLQINTTHILSKKSLFRHLSPFFPLGSLSARYLAPKRNLKKRHKNVYSVILGAFLLPPLLDLLSMLFVFTDFYKLLIFFDDFCSLSCRFQEKCSPPMQEAHSWVSPYGIYLKMTGLSPTKITKKLVFSTFSP